MKKLYFLFIVILSWVSPLGAQNGVTSYSSTVAFSSFASKRSSFVIDQGGHKWIGFNSANSQNALLVWYNDTVWRKFNYLFPAGTKINVLAIDGNDDLWVGADNGLYKLHDTLLVSSFPGYNIISLVCGGGNVYMGTFNGLVVYNGSSFNAFTKVNGLASDTILSISYENQNSIWLGEPYGLDKYDGSSNFIFNFISGSQADSVLCIYLDALGNKWLGTKKHGVIKYDNTSFLTMQQLYGEPTGVGWPTRTHSICRGPNGGIFFADKDIDWMTFNTPIPPPRTGGALELMNNAVLIYKNVGRSELSTPSLYKYYCFQYDPLKGEVYFVPINYAVAGGKILYSFNAAQYSEAVITEKNSDYLDINNVKALITSNADMHWDLQGTKYFVPKGSNSSPLKMSSLWMGGCLNGLVRVAANTYRQEGVDFWPGPLDIATDSTDAATSAAYDRVWKIDRYDIANFIYNWNAGNVQNGTFIPAASILNWPANGGTQYKLAPYVDVNGDGYYDPINAGDHPLIKGDQMIWWVFNDQTTHEQTGSTSLGVQVNASAYAFVCPNIADSNRALNYTTFYNFKVMNMSPNKLDSFYMAPWIDADLGNFQDDQVGCDVMNNYAFAYNGDNYDDDKGSTGGYHANMPVLSCNILSGPLGDTGDGRDNNNNGIIDEPGEKCLMSTMTYTNVGTYAGVPNPCAMGANRYYNHMKALTFDCSLPMTYGGNGFSSSANPRCLHAFPGNSDPFGISMGGSLSNPIPPPGNYGSSGWTQGQANVVKNDMRFIIGVGPFTMQPGGTYELDYALVFSQDSANCSGNPDCVLPRAQQDNIRVKRWFDNNSFPGCLSLVGVGIEDHADLSTQISVYPNPASDQVFVEFKEAQTNVTVEVFDVVGKLVKGATFTDSRKYISLPVAEMAKGVYLLQVKTVSGAATKKFIKE